MNTKLKHYIIMAELFEYPDDRFAEKVETVQQFLDAHYPEAAEMLREFTALSSRASRIEMEELFTRSFDVQAVTTLDLGYVLFGDDYKRGELLVNLNREHREAENECYTELSDHLPNVLRLLPKMQDRAIADELVQKVISPSLNRMIKGFEPEIIEAKDKVYRKHHKTIIDKSEDYYRVYQRVLMTLYKVLKVDFQFTEYTETEKTSDFLKSIDSEITIEGE